MTEIPRLVSLVLVNQRVPLLLLVLALCCLFSVEFTLNSGANREHFVEEFAFVRKSCLFFSLERLCVSLRFGLLDRSRDDSVTAYRLL